MKLRDVDTSKLLGFDMDGDPLFDVVVQQQKSDRSHAMTTGKAVGGTSKPTGNGKPVGTAKPGGQVKT